MELMKADPSRRMVAWFIDWLCTIPFQMIGLIPIIGQFIALVCLMFYWLLRDIGGASLGKRMMGLKVATYDGRTPGLGRRAKRNILFALTCFMLLIPFIGIGVFLFAFGVTVIVEVLLIFSRGESMGDRGAKLLVVNA